MQQENLRQGEDLWASKMTTELQDCWKHTDLHWQPQCEIICDLSQQVQACHCGVPYLASGKVI